MKAIVLGSTGMVGSCFVDKLMSSQWDVVGVARPTALGRHIIDRPYRFAACDILDRPSLCKLFTQEKPDLVVNMAAQAFNGASWDSEYFTYLTNIEGTLNVLNAVKSSCPNTQVILACSSAEYGDILPTDCPLVESRQLKPITPYGVTKVATECMGFQFFKNYGTQVFLPRMFIHVGTGHPPATAIQNFARQVALIKNGKIPPVIRTGNIQTARDFIDVRDGVDAMLMLLAKWKPGIPINICNGVAPKISDVLQTLISLAGVEVEVQQDDALLRPSDEPLLLGDNTHLRSLGWKRSFTLEQTLEEVLNDWIQRANV